MGVVNTIVDEHEFDIYLYWTEYVQQKRCTSLYMYKKIIWGEHFCTCCNISKFL